LFIWEGYHEVNPESCGNIWRDMHYWRLGTYNSFTERYNHHPNGAGGNNNLTTWTLTSGNSYVETDNSTLAGIENINLSGPGTSTVVGRSQDNYSIPVTTAVYDLPGQLADRAGDLHSDTTDVEFAVRISFDHRLNIWKGDINNLQHLDHIATTGGTVFDQSPHYDPEHLRNQIRFYVNAPSLIPCLGSMDTTSFSGGSTVLINPDQIAYVGDTCHLNQHGYYIQGNFARSGNQITVTGNNTGGDVILAVFRASNACQLRALSNLAMEIDLEPVCNRFTRINSQPDTGAIFDQDDYVNASEVSIRVFLSPAPSCNADSIDTDSTLQALSTPPHWNMSDALRANIAENIYNIACSDEQLTVQCPGCFIAGMYNIGLQLKRMTYGRVDADDNGIADLPQTPIVFDQKNFRAVSINDTLNRYRGVADDRAMYGDLIRVRIQSEVQLDSAYQTLSFSPSEDAFGNLLDIPIYASKRLRAVIISWRPLAIVAILRRLGYIMQLQMYWYGSRGQTLILYFRTDLSRCFGIMVAGTTGWTVILTTSGEGLWKNSFLMFQ
jgi:hypothetical protein